MLTSLAMIIGIIGVQISIFKEYLGKLFDSLRIFLGLICPDTVCIFSWSLHSYNLLRALHRKWETSLFHAWISKIYEGFVQRKGHRDPFSNTHYQLLPSTLFLLRESYSPVSYTHLTLPTKTHQCRSRWSPYH